MLMKKCLGLIALLSIISLCSCGEAKDIAEVSMAVPENIQANLQENPYLDITDLTYDGTETQNIAIGYDFEDPADNDPVLTYNRYRSKDGEVFCFDMQGRLCKYEKTDLTEMEKAETASAQSTSAKPAIAAFPVSPDVAVKMTISFFTPFFFAAVVIRCGRMESAMSLNAIVAPWNSSR